MAAPSEVGEDHAASGEDSNTDLGDAAAYEPNAALVNYYSSEGDTLCGHQVRGYQHEWYMQLGASK